MLPITCAWSLTLGPCNKSEDEQLFLVRPGKTLLFYDLETSGLSKSFAQVVEFAAIRTDMTLREIERTHFYVKLTRDVIPEPDAFATHRLSMQTLADGLAEPEAITTIHQLLNEPGTISLGYNTLGFDDEFLRFSFYRAFFSFTNSS